jgi:hypothetical protein
MKKIIYLFVLALSLVSCEDVIDLETPTGEPQLNIDAHFRVYTEETPARTEGFIKITESVNFFDEDIPNISNAVVNITERGTSNTYNFVENGINTGTYVNNDLSFLNDFDAVFDLNITIDDITYTSSAQLISSTPILGLEQGDLEIFGEEDIEIIISFEDPADIENYYLFDFEFNLYAPIRDEFFNGNFFQFTYLYTEDDASDISPGDLITVSNEGIDKQFYEYMELLLEQVDGGGPFSSPPAVVRGNIINPQDSGKNPLGYFRISEVFTESIVIE